MKFIIYTSSEAFKKYFSGLVNSEVEFKAELNEAEINPDDIYFLHISSYGNSSFDWLKNSVTQQHSKIVVCSNLPNINEMLEVVRLGAKAYCNCFMQTQHYLQLIRLVENNQSWFPPEMLSQTFELAHKAVYGNDESKLLADLTNREKDIAKAVSKGLSNKDIAEEFKISEPTVKTHLTNIFKKLKLKDRVALVLYLKQN